MASLLAAGSLTGCGTVPDSRIVPEGFAPPGTPVDVQLQWDGGGPTVFYDHTQSGAVAATAGAGIVGLLLLPLALITDLSIEASNASRERKARRIANSIGGLPDRSTVEDKLEESLRVALGWVAPQQPPSPGTPDPLVLAVAPAFALRTDARALLFEFRLLVCRAESVFPGKLCADDRPLEARVFVHSDVLPAPVKDDATRARLLAIIDDETGIEDLARGDRARVEQARTQARERARSDNLYPEEATMLAIDAWVADSGALLKQAFTGATRALAQAMQAMRDHPGPPAHNRMSVSRVIFPMFYDDQLPVGDLDEFRVDPDGRRLLRSRIEPMRGAGSTDDQAANVWFSVPAATDRDEVPEKALIEFLYRWPVAPGKDGS